MFGHSCKFYSLCYLKPRIWKLLSHIHEHKRMFEMSSLICAKIYEQFIQKLLSCHKYKYLLWQTVHINIYELLISDHVR